MRVLNELPFLLLALLPLVTSAGFANGALSTSDLNALDVYLTDNSGSALENLISFLKIPSVSSDPSRKQDVRIAAEWLLEDLKSGGFENVQLLETKLHPSVYGDWLHAPGAPTVLIYGHYDVQPEDPIDLWKNKPFEPTVMDDRVYARGATDDKGNLYIPLTVAKAFLSVRGELPVNVKVLIEGEEEIGSPNLVELLSTHSRLLRADFAVSADGGQPLPDVPGLCLGLRGIVAMELTVTVAEADMHSGIYGGGVQNPIHALSHLLSSLHDMKTGRILVDGFYDGVEEPSAEEREDLSVFPQSERDMLGLYGVNESFGEEGFTFLERTALRPTIEIVGISGGFQGDGMKTVLPRRASVKISSRLVSGQSSGSVLTSIRKHLQREAEKIKGIKLSFTSVAQEAEGYKMEKRTLLNRIASRVLKEVFNREPVFYSMGGSIPAILSFKQNLGIDSVLFGFANQDERAHSPDEFFRLESIRLGEKAGAIERMLEHASAVRHAWIRSDLSGRVERAEVISEGRPGPLQWPCRVLLLPPWPVSFVCKHRIPPVSRVRNGVVDAGDEGDGLGAVAAAGAKPPVAAGEVSLLVGAEMKRDAGAGARLRIKLIALGARGRQQRAEEQQDKRGRDHGGQRGCVAERRPAQRRARAAYA
ncbi:Peptidase M20 [Gracilaria domingensis]|nr:Peptidase M20 [Gracilaria domingensis]